MRNWLAEDGGSDEDDDSIKVSVITITIQQCKHDYMINEC